MKRIIQLFISILVVFTLEQVYAREVETVCDYFGDSNNTEANNYLGMTVYFYDDGTVSGSYYYDGHKLNPPTPVTKFENSDEILQEYRKNKECPKYVLTFQTMLSWNWTVKYHLFYNESEKNELVAERGLLTNVYWAPLQKSESPNEPIEVPDGYTTLSKTYSSRSNSSKQITFSIQYNESNGYFRRGVFRHSDGTISPILVHDSIRCFQGTILERSKKNEWPSDLYCGTLSVNLRLKDHQVVYSTNTGTASNGDFVCTFNSDLFLGTDYQRFTISDGYLYTPSACDVYEEENPGGSTGSDPWTPPEQDPAELDVSSFCQDAKVARTLKFVGLLLFLAKIFVPALIIILGCLDFFKVMTAGKDDEIKKRLPILIKRFIAGVIIFFIPSVVNFLFNIVEENFDSRSPYSNCRVCILDPNSCEIGE